MVLIFCLSPLPVFSEESGRPGNPQRPEQREGRIGSDRMDLGLEEAILLSLENNRSLRVERLNPNIRATFEEEEWAVFDPVLGAEFAFSRERGEERPRSSRAGTDNTDSRIISDVEVSKRFPTGTDLSLALSAQRTWSDLYTDQVVPRVGLSVTQALLRGGRSDANLASVEQARLNVLTSEYELRGFTEALVAQVEQTYWEYALALRKIQIYEESLRVAEQQVKEIQEMIGVGRMPETEMAAAESEIAVRKQGLINARSEAATTRLRLLRLLNPPGPDPWDRGVQLRLKPDVPEVTLDGVQSHVEVALRLRPDLNQARLALERNELEIVKTRNGLLPKLDLFLTLGKTGYADSFGSAASDMDGDYYDVGVGLRFEFPLKNRAAHARHRRSELGRDQAGEALDNLAQLVELDVRTAYIEVNRAREQIGATSATRRLQEEKLRVERERFRVGRSTMFLVAQAERDLLVSQLAEVETTVNYLKALIDLFRLEGSLLDRRRIEAPGRKPVAVSSRP
ncbi:MAG: TolC family protein [Deltaproteobacteria bacterium]|nr:TolC family protein [Deltaproteobacteria bacterium]